MKYFIDTNIIIDFLDKKEVAIEQLKTLAQEEESELFINRLVAVETLRTIRFSHKKIFREAEEKLSFFRKLDIEPEIYEEAIQFSRYCHSKGIKLKGKCEAIDFLHFITAKYYHLILISNDRDLDRLESSYGEFYTSQKNPTERTPNVPI